MGIENGKIKPLAPADSSGSKEINKSDTFIFRHLYLITLNVIKVNNKIQLNGGKNKNPRSG